MKENLREIRDRMDKACESVGRDPAEITLIAVSKTFPIDAIEEAYDLGLRDFGESRLQEAQPKIESLPDDNRWHFIGVLQSNKAKKIGQLFSVVHTIAAESHLKEINKANRQIEAFIELNIAKEAQKSGISPESLDEFIKKVIQYPHVHLLGLMTIGPAENDPEAMRPYFQRTKKLNDQIGGTRLSMGMSGDFDVAIQEGASHIRVGTALFGVR